MRPKSILRTLSPEEARHLTMDDGVPALLSQASGFGECDHAVQPGCPVMGAYHITFLAWEQKAQCTSTSWGARTRASPYLATSTTERC